MLHSNAMQMPMQIWINMTTAFNGKLTQTTKACHCTDLWNWISLK